LAPRSSASWFSITFFVVLLTIGWGAFAGLYDAGLQFVPPVD
jgi:hypothetical protein